MKKLRNIIVCACLLLGIMISTPAFAELSLEWEASTEPDLAGYIVYIGKEGISTSYVDVGNVTSVTFSQLGVPEKKGYMFFVTAYDTSGNESTPSNMVSNRKGKWPMGILDIVEVP